MSDTTAICPITNPTKLPCGHEFDTDAIDEWCESHDTCPICRAPTERGVTTETISNATTIRQEMQEIRNERLRLDRRARELELIQRHLDSRSSTPTMRYDRPSRYKRFRAALDSAGEAITCTILRWGIRTFT